MGNKKPSARKLTYEQKAINLAFEFRNEYQATPDKYQEEILRKSLFGKLVSARLKLRTNPIRACQKFHEISKDTEDSGILFEEAVALKYCARLAREDKAKLATKSERTLQDQEKNERLAEAIMEKIGTKEFQAAGYLLFKFFNEGATVSREIFMYGIYSAAFGSVAENTQKLPDLGKQEPDRKLRPSQKELTMLSGKEILEIIRLLVIANWERTIKLTATEKEMLLKPFNYLIDLCKEDGIWKAEKWEFLCANLVWSHGFINENRSKELNSILHGANSPFKNKETSCPAVAPAKNKAKEATFIVTTPCN